MSKYARLGISLVGLVSLVLVLGLYGFADQATPVKGGNLLIAFESTIQDTGDVALTTSSHSRFIAHNIVDTLIAKDPADGNLYPYLATSWEIAPDGLSITLHLRKDVTFHDGTPFNAQAVKFNFDYISTKAQGYMSYGILGCPNYYDTTEVLDAYTIKISYMKPYARMVSGLAHTELAMNSPEARKQYGDKYGTEMVVGTGPFKWVSWTGPTGTFTAIRNEDYNWAPTFYKHQGPAYLDGFTIKGVSDPSTRVSAVEAGSADVSIIQSGDVSYFTSLAGFRTVILPKIGTDRFLTFNLQNPILQDIRVRQAISYAIDREALLNSAAYQGVAKVGLSVMSAATWGGSSAEFAEAFTRYNYLYDLDKAKKLLEEVGWTDTDGDGIREAHGVTGVKEDTRFHLIDNLLVQYSGDSEMLQAMLAEVGIEVELQPHNFATWWSDVQSGRFDITFTSDSGSSLFILESMFLSDDPQNITHYSNPIVDDLFAAAGSSANLEVQRLAFKTIQQLVLRDAAAVPVLDWMYPWAMREGVKDIRADSDGIGLYLYDTWSGSKP